MSGLSPLLGGSLLWITVTIGLFEAADWVSRRTGRHPLANSVLWSVPAIIAVLLLTHTPYATYAAATQPLSFLLGPATVALAVPLWRNMDAVKKAWKPIAAALAAGSVTAIVSAVGVAWAFGAPHALLASIAPRSVTTPVAMALAGSTGGIPAVAAVTVLMSAVFGVMVASPLFNVLGLRDPRARGFAAGMAAHGLGTARAFQVSETAGIFAGAGMAMNAVLTALLLTVAALV